MLSGLQSIFRKSVRAGAATPTNWALLVRSEGPDATEFIEIRQNARAVWSARGKPYTLGQKELREFQNTVEAEAFIRQAIAENQARGLTLLHSGRSIPGELDFDLLEEAIYDGARQAYQRICDDHPEEIISGFALFTDFDGMTICPAGMAESSFDDVEDEEEFYRSNPSEWPYMPYVGLLLAYRMIVVAAYEHHAIPFETEVPGYFDQFFETCIKALERLDGDGVFGQGAGRENFLLLFGLSDGGPTKATLKRLNPEGVYQRYAHCFDE